MSKTPLPPTKPFTFQKRNIRTIERKFNCRGLIADEMGLGKTLQALWLIRRNCEGPAIVVTEATIKHNWKREAWAHMQYRACVLEGRKPNITPQQLRQSKLIVINYDILANWVVLLRRLRAEMIVLDECHNLTNPRAARTKAVMKLCKNTQQIVAMSGTPVRNCPIEIWPVAKLLCADEFGNWRSFAEQHCQLKVTRWGVDARGAKDIKTLSKRLRKHIMVRNRKTDVLDTLPPKSRETITLRNELDHRYRVHERAYRELVRNMYTRNQSARFRHLVMGKQSQLKQLAARGKMRGVFDWLDNMLATTDDKLVVFGIHKRIMRMLAERYKHNSVTIVGDTPQKQRAQRVEQFETTTQTRLLLGNIRAAGVGINLTAARRAVMVELSWVPTEHAQAESRVWRIGQNMPTEITYFVARNTIEEKLCEVIAAKQDIVNGIIDGKLHKGNWDTMKLLAEHERNKK